MDAARETRIAILKKDHDTLKELFETFEKTGSSAEREKTIARAVEELKLHAAIEENIFYPTVRKHVGKDLLSEADEEHHVARVLIAELDANAAPYHRHAKFTVLAESVWHHIKEEETMLPKAKELDIDFEALGQQMLARKKDPARRRHAMLAKANGKATHLRPRRRERSSQGRHQGACRRGKEVWTCARESLGGPYGNKIIKRAFEIPHGSKGKRKIHKVMKEHKQGTLKSGSGKKVKSRKQAVAIALSEARKSGAKIPRKKKS